MASRKIMMDLRGCWWSLILSAGVRSRLSSSSAMSHPCSLAMDGKMIRETVGALCLLRNALLAIVEAQADDYPSMPAFLETVVTDQRLAFALITKRL